MSQLEVSLAPSNIGSIGPIMVTNAMFTTFVCTLMLLFFAFWMGRKASVIPGRIQILFEMMVTLLLDKLAMAFGSEARGRKYFPYFFTIFIFLVLANNFTWIPFVESIVTEDGVKIFTTPSAHYSLTIAMALFMIVFTQIVAFCVSPIRHIGNYIKIGAFFKARSVGEFMMGFTDILLGILELVGEIAKVISLSTRLFGNMFAGGVIIGIISALSFYTQFFFGIPFLLLGIISGFVQAFVITFLGILFASGTIDAAMPPQKASQ